MYVDILNYLYCEEFYVIFRYLCLLAYSDVQHILCCVCVPYVLVSVDCPFFIASSVFSNVYLKVCIASSLFSNVYIKVCIASSLFSNVYIKVCILMFWWDPRCLSL
jgi:hypothetical protein